jgi:hypothetical protein
LKASRLAYQHRKVMDAIVRCRTVALGGHRDQCLRCGHQAISYNSCRNRHCPKCQGNARAKWLAARSAELLPVPYFHVVFTSAAALIDLGADIGLLSVLHTWGQNLQHHPHVHCVVPAGGLALDGSRWISASSRFFLPVRVLSRVFRAKFIAGLKQLVVQGKLKFHGSLQELAKPERFRQFLRQLYSNEWVVYAKPPFGGAEHVLHYLARYTHRVAISNHRLVACKEDRVSFRWKDYAHGGKQKVMTVSTDEFLRRFLIHVLPKGLVRIRHSGLFANRRRAASLLRCRALLNASAPAQQPTPGCQPRCPLCSEPMFILERITSAQLLVRSLTASASKPRGIDSS